MSRFDELDDWDPEPDHWFRIDVERAFRSKPGQERLRQLLAALDAMPRHELAMGTFVDVSYDSDDTPRAEVCALGALAASRELERSDTPIQWDAAAEEAGYAAMEDDPWEIAHAMKGLCGWPIRMALRIQWVNDEVLGGVSPSERWASMRAWVASQIGNPDPWRAIPPIVSADGKASR